MARRVVFIVSALAGMGAVVVGVVLRNLETIHRFAAQI